MLGKILCVLGVVFYVLFFICIFKAGSFGGDYLRNGLLSAVNGSVLFIGGLVLSK